MADVGEGVGVGESKRCDGGDWQRAIFYTTINYRLLLVEIK